MEEDFKHIGMAYSEKASSTLERLAAYAELRMVLDVIPYQQAICTKGECRKTIRTQRHKNARHSGILHLLARFMWTFTLRSSFSVAFVPFW